MNIRWHSRDFCRADALKIVWVQRKIDATTVGVGLLIATIMIFLCDSLSPNQQIESRKASLSRIVAGGRRGISAASHYKSLAKTSFVIEASFVINCVDSHERMILVTHCISLIYVTYWYIIWYMSHIVFHTCIYTIIIYYLYWYIDSIWTERWSYFTAFFQLWCRSTHQRTEDRDHLCLDCACVSCSSGTASHVCLWKNAAVTRQEGPPRTFQVWWYRANREEGPCRLSLCFSDSMFIYFLSYWC